jgi:hypothetical protein
MSTFQTMKYSGGENRSIEFSEAFVNGGVVRVYMNNGSSGHVDFNRDHLIKLRNYINIQIAKLPKP